MNTAYLVPSTWDFALDINGDLAMASDPYSLAQDAASAILCFQGECWYNTELGNPYNDTVFGKLPNLQLIKSYFVSAAMTVPGVVAAQVFISGFDNRKISGQVQVTTASGGFAAVGF